MVQMASNAQLVKIDLVAAKLTVEYMCDHLLRNAGSRVVRDAARLDGTHSGNSAAVQTFTPLLKATTLKSAQPSTQQLPMLLGEGSTLGRMVLAAPENITVQNLLHLSEVTPR